MKQTGLAFSILIIFLLVMSVIGCGSESVRQAENMPIKEIDLSAYSDQKPDKKLRLLFIHHSCGATLMADKGEKTGPYCLYSSHPNGGALRALLVKNNYEVHEATYGSKIGQDTNICHWHAKFRDNMAIILKTDTQDKLYQDDSVNNVVVFKSCYPANNISSDGVPPGDPDSPEKTVANYKAAYNSLLPLFSEHPETLFVAMTAPPLVKPRMNFLKEFLLNLVGKGPEKIGRRARMFNNWLKDIENRWLSSYALKNVVVFDYYDILTGEGKSNWSKYPTRKGTNSHPSSEGNTIAAKKFIDFLNRAVRYAGINRAI